MYGQRGNLARESMPKLSKAKLAVLYGQSSIGVQAMTERTYWLCLFNPTTWREFLEAGGEVMGFPETRQNTVKRIRPGDYLLAYMTGVSRWIAVLEVVDKPYDDITRIWKQALFPFRVKVRVVTSVDIEAGVPALSLSKQLRMFDNLKTPHWGLLFRIAPKELYPEDGEVIVKAIQEAAQSHTN